MFQRGNPYPPPLEGESFNPQNQPSDVQDIVTLYDESRRALCRGAPSCAVLMFRKLLLHIAVQKGAKKGNHFIEFVEYLKKEKIVGKPQYELLDRIKEAGNVENHEIRRATLEEASDLLDLVTLLVKSLSRKRFESRYRVLGMKAQKGWCKDARESRSRPVADFG